MLKKVLIANRGEIAIRIAKTLQEMGIQAVAVYSEIDRNAPHVRQSDEAHLLPGDSASETYLNSEQIIEIARAHRVEAIHPGYGFLSENPRFAEACEKAGIVFIGPSASAIRALGDKLTAKQIASKAGVPVMPSSLSFPLPLSSPDPGPIGDVGRKRGSILLDSRMHGNDNKSGSDNGNEIKKAAQKIGYPVLLKAAAGGGGKGMRLVRQEGELLPAFEAAQRESQNAFGDSRVFLEKYIEKPRHVEFQIFGDQQGNTVHLYERECSIQRRYQKIIEESPSVALTEKLRAKMGAAAVKIAKAAHYTNAGTVEFLVDAAGRFYFLEMNARLQVEYPVTEMTVRQDLVRAQILVAAGEKLPFKQSDLTPDGHAMECRIYAEDPSHGFLPATGTVECYAPPEGPNIRVDSGIRAGSIITADYDPLLAKLIVWGKTRQDSLRKMQWALNHFVILGVAVNIEFLQLLIHHPQFISGNIHTHFLNDYPIQRSDTAIPEDAKMAAQFLANQQVLPPAENISNPWSMPGKSFHVA